MKEQLKRILKKNKSVKKVYDQITTIATFNPSLGEITPLDARESILKDKRINLLVPSINQEHIFGGISTALKFYEQLADHLGYKRRIITTDASPSDIDMQKFPKYKLTHSSEDLEDDFLVLPFNDRYNKTIPVGENDYFMSTAWWTAYATHNLMRWQVQTYHTPIKKSVYFIQDFEPGFYAWSSQYALADSTYKSEVPQIAVFNTKLLKDYFKQNDYQFKEEYYFEPQLNESLKVYLNKIQVFDKKKQILIYGRPSVKRNAFEIIVETLKLWVWKQPDIAEWKIYSAGEKHPEVDLGNGAKLISVGKLSLEDYAKLMAETYIGISLMISPHPSYPPLEMASFGAKVITNTYANKDLSNFDPNIISVDSIDPKNLVDILVEQCKNYKMTIEKHQLNKEYVSNDKLFKFITDISLEKEA